jgi:hypothetical protein
MKAVADARKEKIGGSPRKSKYPPMQGRVCSEASPAHGVYEEVIL